MGVIAIVAISAGVKFGVNWEEIAERNNIESPYLLEKGQKLTIPINKMGRFKYKIRKIKLLKRR